MKNICRLYCELTISGSCCCILQSVWSICFAVDWFNGAHFAGLTRPNFNRAYSAKEPGPISKPTNLCPKSILRYSDTCILTKKGPFINW